MRFYQKNNTLARGVSNSRPLGDGPGERSALSSQRTRLVTSLATEGLYQLTPPLRGQDLVATSRSGQAKLNHLCGDGGVDELECSLLLKIPKDAQDGDGSAPLVRL